MYQKYLLIILCSLLYTNIAVAATDPFVVISKENQNLASSENYWTPERMANALPMELPQATLSKRVDSLDSGSSNAQFSSQPLVPISADLSYPYRTVGKLFFKSPTGDRYCSAAVIANRLVTTAAHCIHNGNASPSGWNSDWTFVPAYRDGAMPFERWIYMRAGMWNGWYTSGGVVPNRYDYAFLSFADKNIGGSVRKLADVVGKLGFKLLSTIPNHATILGYPGALDSGQRMHQVTAQSAVAVAPNNAEYGSDMGVGADGGPWIQNFGVLSAGQSGGKDPIRNLIIGVTSYSNNPALMNGSVILDSQYLQLYNIVCDQEVGNC